MIKGTMKLEPVPDSQGKVFINQVGEVFMIRELVQGQPELVKLNSIMKD